MEQEKFDVGYYYDLDKLYKKLDEIFKKDEYSTEVSIAQNSCEVAASATVVFERKHQAHPVAVEERILHSLFNP
jgi:hypothetical protein